MKIKACLSELRGKCLLCEPHRNATHPHLLTSRLRKTLHNTKGSLAVLQIQAESLIAVV